MARPSIDARLKDIDRVRDEVIASPLAKGICLQEVASFLGRQEHRRFPQIAFDARGNRPLIQPRGGVPLFTEQLALTRRLYEAGADFIPLTVDSYTRHNQYETAALMLERSEEEEKSYLNGYPLVTHGYELTRELYRGIEKPVSLRHGTPDARLLAEVAIASGITEIEGGGICYCVPYSEGFPLDRALIYWQYVDRICALSSTEGRLVHRESFGPLTATLVPPAIAIVVQVLELLMAAEQGVKSFSVSFGQSGSVIQDMASARILRKLARVYLDEYGFDDVQIYLVYHQWMGQFPPSRSRAAALISGSTLLGSFMGADKIVVKTVDEALGIPDADANAEAVGIVDYLLSIFHCPDALTSRSIDIESELIESEVRNIVATIFDLPGNALWQSVYSAFQHGYLDIPFSPHADNANELISARDRNGSIRMVDRGKVPISDHDAAIERNLMEDSHDSNKKTYETLLTDINMMVGHGSEMGR